MSAKQIIRVGEDHASFIINMPCDRTQLLVTVKKTNSGNDQWLSPIGWVDGQKGTLLDCVALGDETCVLIPENYADAFVAGDTIFISSFEVDVEAEMKWPAAIKSAPAPKTDITQDASDSSGLLGRFARKATPIIAAAAPAVKSDIEIRAEEASRAADASRKQMERAQAAQEEAQRRAKEAAELADQARAAEEQRIAEMEKAQIELAEAEAARRAEQARLDEERRLEEIRVAEEARRAEEARQLELARARQAELRAERERLGEELAALSARRDSARDRAKTLRHNLKSAHDLSEQGQVDLSKAEAEIAELTNHYSAALSAQNIVQKDVEALHQRRTALRNTVDETAKSSEKLEARIAKAKSAFEKADRIAQEALAKANAQKDLLTAVQKEANAAQELIATSKERDALLSADISKASANLSDRKTAFAKAQDGLNRAKETKSKAEQRTAQAKADAAALTTNLDQTKSEISAITDRELAISSALTLVDEGRTIEQVRDIAAKAPNVPGFTPVKAKVVKVAKVEAPKISTETPVKPAKIKPAPRRSRSAAMRSRLISARQRAPQALSVASEAAKGRLTGQLMAGAAAIAVAGIIGYTALNSPGDKVRTIAKAPVKSVAASPVQTEVLSAPPVVAKPNVGDAAKATDLTMKPAKAVTTDETVTKEDAKAPAVKPKDMSAKKATMPAPEKAVLKDAPAVEIFDYQLAFDEFMAEAGDDSVAAKDTAKAKAKVDLVKVAALPKISAPEIRIRETEVAKPAPKPAAAEKPSDEAATDNAYSGVITRVQTDLSALGFYFGPVDGKMSPEFTQSMTDYKALYGLSAGDRITGELLNSLTRSRREADRLEAQQALIPAEAPAVQTASIAPIADYVEVEPEAPTVTQETAITPPEPEPVQLAAITPVPVAPASDVIVEAKRINKLSGTYPERAISRGFEETVVMNFSYDIDTRGRASNIVMLDIDYSGTYARNFEKAGIDSIKSLRFSPKTVNGVADVSKGQEQRITFRVQ